MLDLKTQNHNHKSFNLRDRTYQFSLEVVKFVNKLPNKRGFWSIGDQLLRSATSIGANITEAKASSSKREFIKYYEIALKSANETEYWLSLLKDSYPLLVKDCETLLIEVREISKMLGSSLITMKGKRSY